MNNIFTKINFGLLAGLTTCFCFQECSIQAACTASKQHSLHHYFHNYPWIGLITNEITYGPIIVSHVDLNNKGKVVIVKPKEKIKGTLVYSIDACKMETFHLYHLIVGIKKVGAQDCVTHSFGIWDSQGKGKFTLVAPEKKGVYEVRFSYFEGLTCQSAHEAWDQNAGEPANAATIAVIIVE